MAATFKHMDHWHDVVLGDYGTPDTVIDVDGTELRFSEVDRRADGSIPRQTLIEPASGACDDGMLAEEAK
jgi:hypothetical protein